MNLTPIGYVRSSLTNRTGAPRQGWEGAPDVRIDVDPTYVEALDGLAPDQEVWIFTWLHQGKRETLKVHPRGETQNPLTGVFATRSPDRPNPIGLHRATILAVSGASLEVRDLEAIDGTPIIDIKPVIEQSCGR